MCTLVEPQSRGGAEIEGVTLRAAAPGDIPLLQRLAEETWLASYSEMLSREQIEYMLSWMYGAEKIASELVEGVVWQIAEIQGEPVGYCSLQLDPPKAQSRLNKLYVVPAWQRHGCGRQMLEHALRGARASGAREMSLSVSKRNHGARRLYEQVGFQISSEVVFEIGASFVMDDFIMLRPLP